MLGNIDTTAAERAARDGRAGDNDAYRVLQLLRSKIRLNFVGPSQVRIRVQYLYPILDFRITNIRYHNKYWGGVRGDEAPPGTGIIWCDLILTA